jgi:cobalt transporter subunit CbtB
MQVKRADAVLGAAPAAMPGMPVIGVLGFSHVEKFRNAAHDVRLSIGFRCH